tara:strand:- start:421 stop:900 length:480 start_codon:yes stop_codon:yes gene_type:complete
MKESWTINSPTSLVAFTKAVEDSYKEKKYITFSAPRIGRDRSLDQNALFHVWITEYAAYRLKIHKKAVYKGLIEGMKQIIKKRFTATHPESYSWMVFEVVNPFNLEATSKEYTSSSSWKKGEMFLVLTWFQMVAAEDGLILESKGQFEKLQRTHNGESS